MLTWCAGKGRKTHCRTRPAAAQRFAAAPRPLPPVQGDGAAPQGRERHHAQEVPGGRRQLADALMAGAGPPEETIVTPLQPKHTQMCTHTHTHTHTHTPPPPPHQGLAKDLEEQREALTAQQAAQAALYATIKGGAGRAGGAPAGLCFSSRAQPCVTPAPQHRLGPFRVVSFCQLTAGRLQLSAPSPPQAWSATSPASSGRSRSATTPSATRSAASTSSRRRTRCARVWGAGGKGVENTRKRCTCHM